MSTRDEIVNRYKDDEKAAIDALKSARGLNFTIGMRDATNVQHAQLVERLCEAFKQGHLYASLSFFLSFFLPVCAINDVDLLGIRAERLRGDFLAMFHAPNPNSVELNSSVNSAKAFSLQLRLTRSAKAFL